MIQYIQKQKKVIKILCTHEKYILQINLAKLLNIKEILEKENKNMSEITLTKKQEEALKIAVARYNIGMPYTVVSGYA